MNMNNFALLLENLGVPVACNRFIQAVDTPFIVYLDTDSENFSADNKVYFESRLIDIRLYTDTINDELETQLKRILTNNGFYYDWTRIWIESEKMFQTTFEVIL